MYYNFFIIICYFKVIGGVEVTEYKEWPCANNQQFIKLEYLCDYHIDCDDGSDETAESCPDVVCGEHEFKCDNSKCISVDFRCDEDFDCMDGDTSDEDGCNNTVTASECSGNDFKCGDEPECLRGEWRCDGESDCRDNSDEWGCDCPVGVHRCDVVGRSICLDEWAVCDGTTHCDDGSDEVNCTFSQMEDWDCPADTYRCVKVAECIHRNLVCDGRTDCADSSDEGGLCHATSCLATGFDATTSGPHATQIQPENKICEKGCMQTPIGAMCFCDEGYRLSEDGIHCKDINECEEGVMGAVRSFAGERWCSQKCINTEGSFICACEEGYDLDSNGFHCKATGVSSPILYFSTDNVIRKLTLRSSIGSPMEEIIAYKSPLSNEMITSMAFSSAFNILFWGEKLSSKIRMINQYGSVEDIVVLENGYVPTSVAYDWLSKALYYASVKIISNNGAKRGNINVVPVFWTGKDERTTQHATILDGLKEPSAILACPHKKKLVVADKGTKSQTEFDPVIYISGMNGDKLVKLVSKNLLPVDSMAYDHVKDRLYWTSNDRHDAKVERISLNGHSREVVLVTMSDALVLRPWSITLFEDSVYLADSNKHEVEVWEEAPVTTGSTPFQDSITKMKIKSFIKLSKVERMSSIMVAHPVLQKPNEQENLCSSKMCEFVCVLLESEYDISLFNIRKIFTQASCICPDGFSKSGQRSCKAKPTIVKDFTPISGEITLTPTKTASTTTTPITDPTTTTSTTTSTTKRPDTIRPSPSKQGNGATPCKHPGAVPHATIHPAMYRQRNRTFGARTHIVYKCKHGYYIKESGSTHKTLTCLSSGSWNAPPPACNLQTHVTNIALTINDNSVNKTCDEIKCGKDEVCKYVPISNEPPTARCMCMYGLNKTSMLCLSKTSPITSSGIGKTAVIIIVIIALLIVFAFAFVSCRYYIRQPRSTLNLQYTRGPMVKEGRTTTRRVGCYKGGNARSISNPNYVSPAHTTRRILKADIDNSDSGLEVTSSSSDNETTQPQSTQRLLVDDEDIIVDYSDGPSSGGIGLVSQISTLFSLRKTESTEKMIPK